MNTKKRLSLSFLAGLILCSTALSGCSHTGIATADRHVRAEAMNATDGLFQGQMPLKPQIDDEIDKGVWIGGRTVRADHGASLPYQWETYGLTLQKPQQALSLRQISQKITQATNIPIEFAPDVFAKGAAGAAPSIDGAGAPNAKGIESQSNLNDAIQKLGLSQGGSQGDDSSGETFGSEEKMVVSFKSGPLSSLLNEVSSYFGITWKYSSNDGGKIVFYRNVTRTYHIAALPLSGMTMSTGMTQEMNSSVQGTGTSSQASGGSNNQKTSANAQIEIWKDIETSIKTIIASSGSGGWLSVSRSTGTISVTAPASVMDKVQNFIDTQNAILSKQVNISVKVLSVQMKNSSALDVAMKGLFNNISLGAVGGIGAAADAGSQIAFANKKSSFFIQELEKIGRVEVTTNTNIMTLNGIPAPIQVAHTRGYVAEVQTMVTSTSSSSSSNSQTTLTPGSVTFGFNMMVLPEVMPGNDSVLLHFGSSLSDLNGSKDGFDEFTSGNQTVQLVNVVSRNFQQEAMVPNGTPVVISGFQQSNTSAAKSGTGKASFIGLGGSQSGSEEKTMIVIIVTPVVLSQKAITYTDSI